MAYYKVSVTDEHWRPMQGLTIAAIDLANYPNVSSVQVTDTGGGCAFSGLVGPHWFTPWYGPRYAGSVGDRGFIGRINIEVVSLGEGVNYDYVVDPNGMGTHTTLQAAITAAVTSGARAIWVCTSAGTLREDISIPDTAGETNDGAMFLIHTAPWSSIVAIEDPGELAPAPPRVRLQPSTDDTPAIVAREPVQFQGFRIDNQYPTNHDAQLIVFKGANVIAEFKDCEIVQYDADKPVFSTTWDGASSCDVVKLENCIIRHNSGYYIMSNGFNLAGGLLMHRVSAYGLWDSLHAFRLVVDTSGFKAADATYPVFYSKGGFTEVRLTNSRIANTGAGGCFELSLLADNYDIHIANCHFKGSGAGPGLGIFWTDRCTVVGNTFEDFAGGVYIMGSVNAEVNVRGCIVAGNTFQDCTTGIDDGGNLSAAELATIVCWPNAYYNCTTDSDFAEGPVGGDVGYTPAVGGDWLDPDPDDVAEALDDLADRLQDVTEVDFFVGTATAELSAEVVCTYARGSIIYGAAAAWGVLGKGTDGYFLKSGATDIAWAAITEADISDLQSYVLAHAMLDGSAHSDSVADAVTRGSIIYGNATPKWDELVIGDAGSALGSDGTDISWSTSLALAGTLTVDTIGEYTGAAGVTIDGVLLKDTEITLAKNNNIDFALGATDAATTFMVDYPNISTANALFRIFRQTNTSGSADFQIFKADGTTTLAFEVQADQQLVGIPTTVAGHTLTVGKGASGNIRLRGATTRYRSDIYIDNTSGLLINAYDDTGSVYLPISFTSTTFGVICTALGFFGVTPAARAAAYTPSNVSADRAYDANATTIDELADVLGTLIADLKLYGLLQS